MIQTSGFLFTSFSLKECSIALMKRFMLTGLGLWIRTGLDLSLPWLSRAAKENSGSSQAYNYASFYMNGENLFLRRVYLSLFSIDSILKLAKPWISYKQGKILEYDRWDERHWPSSWVRSNQGSLLYPIHPSPKDDPFSFFEKLTLMLGNPFPMMTPSPRTLQAFSFVFLLGVKDWKQRSLLQWKIRWQPLPFS